MVDKNKNSSLTKKDKENFDELYSLVDKQYVAKKYINQASVLSKIEKGLVSEINAEQTVKNNRKVSSIIEMQNELKGIVSDLSQDFQLLKDGILRELHRLGRGQDEISQASSDLRVESIEEPSMVAHSYSESSSSSEIELEHRINALIEWIDSRLERLDERLNRRDERLLEEQDRLKEKLKSIDVNFDTRLQSLEQRMQGIELSLEKIIENQEYEREAALKLLGVKLPPKKK